MARGGRQPDQPFDPVAPAISAHIPLIIGTNRDEATLFLVLADTGFNMLDEAGLQTRVQALAGDAAQTLIAGDRTVTCFTRMEPSSWQTLRVRMG